MSLRATCPSCACHGDIEAFLVEPDAKRLLARLAAIDAQLVRPAIAYLRLFKPAKQVLRLTRATRLVDDLAELVAAGTVCRDERADERRAAPVMVWVQGIEQMLASPPSGLPLSNHHYLRSVVFALAETAAAKAEQQVEQQRRSGRRVDGAHAEDPLVNARRYAAHMVSIGAWDRAQHDRHVADAELRHGGAR